MKRPFWAYLFVALLLGTFGGLTYLTRHPDAEILRRAESWPGVGPLASRFREAYRPPRPAGDAEGTEQLRPPEGDAPATPTPPPP